jgi:signal transduction histidine kinase
MHITVSYLETGTLTPDSLVRTCMFVIAAFVVGAIAEQMNSYRDQLAGRNQDLLETNTRLESSQSAYEIANKKLNLLSTITRHDIKNQVTGLLGFLELSKEKTTDPDLLHFIDREESAAQNIQRQIEFTKNYEDIGVRAPQWQDIGIRVRALQTLIPPGEITVSVAITGLEVFADPLLEKVFENLIDNSRRHGERVRHISFSTLQYGLDYLALVYEDDGIGVHEADKERIFEKGFGKNTGLGLFLTREILSITGLEIKETGVYGRGVRFEIMVPKGKYRFSPSQEKSGK